MANITVTERRRTPHDRHRVAGIGSIWAALALLAAGAALFQPDVDPPPPPPPAPVPRVPDPAPDPAPEFVVGSWLGVVPNSSEPLDAPAPTF